MSQLGLGTETARRRRPARAQRPQNVRLSILRETPAGRREEQLREDDPPLTASTALRSSQFRADRPRPRPQSTHPTHAVTLAIRLALSNASHPRGCA